MIPSPQSILMIAAERIARLHAEAARRALVATARADRARGHGARPRPRTP